MYSNMIDVIIPATPSNVITTLVNLTIIRNVAIYPIILIAHNNPFTLYLTIKIIIPITNKLISTIAGINNISLFISDNT